MPDIFNQGDQCNKKHHQSQKIGKCTGLVFSGSFKNVGVGSGSTPAAGAFINSIRLFDPIYFPMVVNLVRDQWLFLVVRCLGNHEFPDHEKNDLDLDFLLLMSCAFIHEFPFFKIKQQAGNCFTRYLQRRKKQFPEK